jgi:hypothetical protein
VVHECGWCQPLQLQELLLEVVDRILPLLKLSILYLNGVLKVYDLVGTDIHLLTCDIEQLTGVVPPMLSLTKMTIHDLQLAVLL